MTTNSNKPGYIYLMIIIFCGACWVAVVCSMMGRVLGVILALLIVIIAPLMIVILIGKLPNRWQ